jgi:hypothetical protein
MGVVKWGSLESIMQNISFQGLKIYVCDDVEGERVV